MLYSRRSKNFNFGRKKNVFELETASSDATRCEVRGKQDTPSKELSKGAYDGMEEGKGGRVEKVDGRKVRISQGPEDKPEISLYYTLRYNLHICKNRKSA
jgi:hypothetical protein